MLNLVVSYKYLIDKAGAYDNNRYDYSAPQTGDVFYIENFENFSRTDRIELFESIKQTETKLSKDMMAFSGEIKDYVNQYFLCHDPKLEVSILTDQEIIMLDAKKVFSGESVLEKVYH